MRQTRAVQFISMCCWLLMCRCVCIYLCGAVIFAVESGRYPGDMLLISGYRMNMKTYWLNAGEKSGRPPPSAWAHNVSITFKVSACRVRRHPCDTHSETLYSKFTLCAFVVQCSTRLTLIPKWDIQPLKKNKKKNAALCHCKTISLLEAECSVDGLSLNALDLCWWKQHGLHSCSPNKDGNKKVKYFILFQFSRNLMSLTQLTLSSNSLFPVVDKSELSWSPDFDRSGFLKLTCLW